MCHNILFLGNDALKIMVYGKNKNLNRREWMKSLWTLQPMFTLLTVTLISDINANVISNTLETIPITTAKAI